MLPVSRFAAAFLPASFCQKTSMRYSAAAVASQSNSSSSSSLAPLTRRGDLCMLHWYTTQPQSPFTDTPTPMRASEPVEARHMTSCRCSTLLTSRLAWSPARGRVQRQGSREEKRLLRAAALALGSVPHRLDLWRTLFVSSCLSLCFPLVTAPFVTPFRLGSMGVRLLVQPQMNSSSSPTSK